MGSPNPAFLTHLDDSDDSAEVEIQRDEVAMDLATENEALQRQISSILRRLSSLSKLTPPRSSFIPLASIFPMRIDTVSHTKSASQQLHIYRKEHKKLLTRFQRINNTDYAYSVERQIQVKTATVKTLEQRQIALKASNKALERELLRLKSEENETEETANMSDLLAHVILLRDQVDNLEQLQRNRSEGEENSLDFVRKTEKRYKEIKEIAENSGVSLRPEKPDLLKNEYEVMHKKLAMLEKAGFSKEQMRIKELIKELKRLSETEDQLKTLFFDQATELERARIELSQMRNTENRGLYLSLSTSQLEPTARYMMKAEEKDKNREI